MTGHVLLEGGAEFGGQMAAPDRRALALAGGQNANVCILPTAAAPDNNHRRAGENGRRWFQSLGARNVAVLPLLNRSAADRPESAEALAAAGLVYLLGGFPAHLAESLAGSAAWEAILTAHSAGAVVGGSSAGAMVVCEQYYDPFRGRLLPGLNLLPGCCVVPHYNTLGGEWIDYLLDALPGFTVLGIDEQTGALDDAGPEQGRHRWTVYGAGGVTRYQGGARAVFSAGQQFIL